MTYVYRVISRINGEDQSKAPSNLISITTEGRLRVDCVKCVINTYGFTVAINDAVTQLVKCFRLKPRRERMTPT